MKIVLTLALTALILIPVDALAGLSHTAADRALTDVQRQVSKAEGDTKYPSLLELESVSNGTIIVRYYVPFEPDTPKADKIFTTSIAKALCYRYGDHTVLLRKAGDKSVDVHTSWSVIVFMVDKRGKFCGMAHMCSTELEPHWVRP